MRIPRPVRFSKLSPEFRAASAAARRKTAAEEVERHRDHHKQLLRIN
jgi:hypothetical protein